MASAYSTLRNAGRPDLLGAFVILRDLAGHDRPVDDFRRGLGAQRVPGVDRLVEGIVRIAGPDSVRIEWRTNAKGRVVAGRAIVEGRADGPPTIPPGGTVDPSNAPQAGAVDPSSARSPGTVGPSTAQAGKRENVRIGAVLRETPTGGRERSGGGAAHSVSSSSGAREEKNQRRREPETTSPLVLQRSPSSRLRALAERHLIPAWPAAWYQDRWFELCEAFAERCEPYVEEAGEEVSLPGVATVISWLVAHWERLEESSRYRRGWKQTSDVRKVAEIWWKTLCFGIAKTMRPHGPCEMDFRAQRDLTEALTLSRSFWPKKQIRAWQDAAQLDWSAETRKRAEAENL